MPTTVLEDLLDRLTRKKRQDQNISQLAIAQYAAAKLYSKKNTLSPSKLLPWPLSSIRKQEDTLKILQQVLDDEVLPPRAHNAAINRLR